MYEEKKCSTSENSLCPPDCRATQPEQKMSVNDFLQAIRQEQESINSKMEDISSFVVGCTPRENEKVANGAGCAFALNVIYGDCVRVNNRLGEILRALL